MFAKVSIEVSSSLRKALDLDSGRKNFGLAVNQAWRLSMHVHQMILFMEQGVFIDVDWWRQFVDSLKILKYLDGVSQQNLTACGYLRQAYRLGEDICISDPHSANQVMLIIGAYAKAEKKPYYWLRFFIRRDGYIMRAEHRYRNKETGIWLPA